ncbi:hypothetical protein LshimejAT787_0706390 [Lyophyllum shimeji]|uniref:Uncharacterized protein n=1 Tax=Lyophyllum shimeji TaxID=47721 RepID=A0A9P3PR97_LYOSH|nr:hypothetical protein LshimejAT787_0706390 [Lyophyllum shimeji]
MNTKKKCTILQHCHAPLAVHLTTISFHSHLYCIPPPNPSTLPFHPTLPPCPSTLPFHPSLPPYPSTLPFHPALPPCPSTLPFHPTAQPYSHPTPP